MGRMWALIVAAGVAIAVAAFVLEPDGSPERPLESERAASVEVAGPIPARNEVAPATQPATEVQPSVVPSKASEDEVPAASMSQKLEFCKMSASLARTIMEKRQLGVPMVELMEASHSSEHESVKKIATALTVAAYDSPRFDTPEYQRNAVQDFENDTYLECVKTARED